MIAYPIIAKIVEISITNPPRMRLGNAPENGPTSLPVTSYIHATNDEAELAPNNTSSNRSVSMNSIILTTHRITNIGRSEGYEE